MIFPDAIIAFRSGDLLPFRDEFMQMLLETTRFKIILTNSSFDFLSGGFAGNPVLTPWSPKYFADFFLHCFS